MDKLDQLNVGTVIEAGLVTLIITEVYVVEFMGEWQTWFTITRKNDHMGEVTEGKAVELNSLIASLKKHGIIK